MLNSLSSFGFTILLALILWLPTPALALIVTNTLGNNAVIPVAPSNLQATVSGSMVTLTWPPVAGADGYRIYRDSTLVLNDVTHPTYTNLGLSNGMYAYQVETYTGNLVSSLSTPVVVVVSANAVSPGQGKVLGAETSNIHPNGALILEGQTIYLIKDGQRHGFRAPEEYFSHGYQFSQAVTATEGDLGLPEGTVMKALEGSLVLDTADNRTVYMISVGGTKRAFASEEAFKRLGYKFSGLMKINLSDYSAGAVIDENTTVHPEGALVRDGSTVWWIKDGQRMGFESEQIFKTYGFNFGQVVSATAGDIQLSEGAKVKFRDGTLLRDGGTVYVISDGKKLLFSSMDALVARGYRIENIIEANSSFYEYGGALS